MILDLVANKRRPDFFHGHPQQTQRKIRDPNRSRQPVVPRPRQHRENARDIQPVPLIRHPQLMQRKPTRVWGDDAGRGTITATNDLIDCAAQQ